MQPAWPQTSPRQNHVHTQEVTRNKGMGKSGNGDQQGRHNFLVPLIIHLIKPHAHRCWHILLSSLSILQAKCGI